VTDADRLEIMATDFEAENTALRAQVAELQASNASLREQGRATEQERDAARADRSLLRSDLGAIHAIATDAYRAHDWAGMPLFALTAFEQIRDKAADTIEVAAVQVTDGDGEAD
jgi:hypothetical protein